MRFSVANTTEWGTDRRSALELLEDALNLRVPTVYDHDADTDRDVINGPATEAARIVKALERAKKQLESKLKALAANEKKDGGLTFEELGVDKIFTDESHAFKNLFYVSKMTRIAGLPQTASQRAFDMFLKVRHVQRVNGGGGVVFATGTPIANSVAEMFTAQRFLQMGTLQAQNAARHERGSIHDDA